MNPEHPEKDEKEDSSSYLFPLDRVPLTLLRDFRSKVLLAHAQDVAQHEHRAPTLQAGGGYTVERHLSDYTVDIGQFPKEWGLIHSTAPHNLESFIAQEFGRHVESESRFDVLDVGCGRGDFLLDVFEELCSEKGRNYPETQVRKFLKLVGVTLNDFRTVRGGCWSKKGEWHRETTTRDLKDVGADYIVADAINLRKLIRESGDTHFDLIVSNTALPYIKPDKMRADVVRSIYSSLKPGGIAALTKTRILAGEDFSEFKTYQDTEKVTLYLNKVFAQRGLQILIQQIPQRYIAHSGKAENFYGECRILMKKNDRPFYLPIPYDFHGHQLNLHDWAKALPDS